MARLAMRQRGATPEQTVFIGDLLDTDIACGVNAGIDTVLVFSGSSTKEDLAKSSVRPAFTAAGIGEITTWLK